MKNDLYVIQQGFKWEMPACEGGLVLSPNPCTIDTPIHSVPVPGTFILVLAGVLLIARFCRG